MAISLSRITKSVSKCIYTSLYSHFSPQSRPLTTKPFLPELGMCKDGVFNKFMCKNGVFSKFMCTSEMGTKQNLKSLGNGAEINKDLGSVKGSGGNSENQESGGGGGSQKSNEQGKPIRGSPISWISLLLLISTGAGLVFYYDREKKKHIEEEKSGIKLVPVFISVDPERDTVEQVGEYIKEFHPDLIGLTGSLDEVKKAARAYRVYYMKTEEEGSDYLVDHSIVMYLMDPDMEFVKFFGKNYDVDTLTDGVINEIKQYKRAKA